MTQTRRLRILVILALMYPLVATCQSAVAASLTNARFMLVPAGTELSPFEAAASANWQPLETHRPNFGYTQEVAWLRIDVPAGSRTDLLEIAYSQLDHISFYLLEDGELVDTFITGDHYPFSQRPVLNRHFLFPFTPATNSDRQILLEVHTRGSLQVPLALWDTHEFFEHASIEEQLHAVYYGILISVVFFNLFVFFALREPVYLLYVLSTSGYLLLTSNLNGTAFQLIWPGSPGIQNFAMLLTVPLASMFTLLFSRSFLKLKETAPVLNQAVLGLIIVNAVMAISASFIEYNTAIRIAVALAIPSTLLLTAIGPIQLMKGAPQAGYYTLAWGVLTLGSAIMATNKYGLLPSNFITTYGLEIGSAFEAILLTLALAARIYHERQEKLISREAELTAMAARRSAELKLVESAMHNPLTGLPNRTSFEMQANNLMRQAPEKRFGIVLIHLNNLRSVTKTLGHQNSDAILEKTANHLNRIAKGLPGIISLEHSEKGSVFVASLDTETFACFVDASIAENANQSVAHSMKAVRRPIDFLGMKVPLNARLGVAVAPHHGSEAASLIRKAAIAEGSRRARDQGLAYYDPSGDSYSADRLTMVSELQQALANNELRLYLQPKLDCRTGKISGLEALIRWPGRSKPVGADRIIMLAEQTGLIKPLTRWVLRQSLRIRDRLYTEGHTVQLSVNISPNNLREPDFPAFVGQLMNAHPRHKGAIVFEITETSMMQDPANALKAINSLASAGIPVSIDDFGSGYSSLSYIKQLPASEIKIDRSLITDLATREEDRVIVQTTINMCHSLGYRVVAEGVENSATARLLKEMGCDMIQGYLLSPPLPLEEALVWLADRQKPGTLPGSG